ncbi:MAG TPA: MATE family efflux transporter, partial [Armatimonadota bacterium]|nr:MATE family efflux transporter [Armatimonadota bacterium]
LRAAGDVKTPLYTGGTVVLCNVIFDWLLIFGIGPFPEMGIYGAALATAISYVFGMVLILWFLRKSVLRRSLNRLRIHINWFWKLLGIGWPAIIQQLQFSISYSVYMLLIGMLDGATAIQAALTIGLAIESTSFMPGAAYNIAATPLVGQNLGAGQPKRAERCAWYAARHAVIIMSVVAIVFLAIPEYLARIFTQDESVVRLIVSYLRINAVCQPFLAIGMVMSGALLGAGDTRMPTWIEFATFYIIRLPLTWLLAIVFGWHASGAWSAMCISNVLYGILLTLWFMKGRWKYIQLH